VLDPISYQSPGFAVLPPFGFALDLRPRGLDDAGSQRAGRLQDLIVAGLRFSNGTAQRFNSQVEGGDGDVERGNAGPPPQTPRQSVWSIVPC
jgi:hypothetical protein